MTWNADSVFDWRHMEALRKALVERIIAIQPEYDIVGRLSSDQRRFLFTEVDKYYSQRAKPLATWDYYDTNKDTTWFATYDDLFNLMAANSYLDWSDSGWSFELEDIDEDVEEPTYSDVVLTIRYNGVRVYRVTKNGILKPDPNPPVDVDVEHPEAGRLLKDHVNYDGGVGTDYIISDGFHKTRAIGGGGFSKVLGEPGSYSLIIGRVASIGLQPPLRLKYISLQLSEEVQAGLMTWSVSKGSLYAYWSPITSFILFQCTKDIESVLYLGATCDTKAELKLWAIQRKLLLTKLTLQKTKSRFAPPYLIRYKYYLDGLSAYAIGYERSRETSGVLQEWSLGPNGEDIYTPVMAYAGYTPGVEEIKSGRIWESGDQHWKENYYTGWSKTSSWAYPNESGLEAIRNTDNDDVNNPRFGTYKRTIAPIIVGGITFDTWTEKEQVIYDWNISGSKLLNTTDVSVDVGVYTYTQSSEIVLGDRGVGLTGGVTTYDPVVVVPMNGTTIPANTGTVAKVPRTSVADVLFWNYGDSRYPGDVPVTISLGAIPFGFSQWKKGRIKVLAVVTQNVDTEITYEEYYDQAATIYTNVVTEYELTEGTDFIFNLPNSITINNIPFGHKTNDKSITLSVTTDAYYPSYTLTEVSGDEIGKYIGGQGSYIEPTMIPWTPPPLGNYYATGGSGTNTTRVINGLYYPSQVGGNANPLQAAILFERDVYKNLYKASITRDSDNSWCYTESHAFP